jgi:hypothetical protein
MEVIFILHKGKIPLNEQLIEEVKKPKIRVTAKQQSNNNEKDVDVQYLLTKENSFDTANNA